MTVYTETKTFDSLRGDHVLSIDAGTGSVTLAVLHGEEWLTIETWSSDAVEVVSFGNNRTYRFTVTGDATFTL